MELGSTTTAERCGNCPHHPYKLTFGAHGLESHCELFGLMRAPDLRVYSCTASEIPGELDP